MQNFISFSKYAHQFEIELIICKKLSNLQKKL